MSRTKSPEMLRAGAILHGREEATPQELLALAERLKDARRFGTARKLLARARASQPAEALRTRLRQQHALCTYKDVDLPTDARLATALEILQDGEDLRTTRDQETLGLAGAIFKRRWEVDTQKENLERALYYYQRGWLSGGGFRASLFHIGVLARLAELDVLQHVEVLSCVSGGSILGAHYYLEVKRLLEAKADTEITREDWVALVKRLCGDFLDGVQENVRSRVAAEFTTNVKLIFKGGYSRTMRAGELYERCIYSRVQDGFGRRDPRWLTDLYVMPRGERPGDFLPREDNWRRRAKVPDLILNATSLNTGHNWQFTASWMGEPPGSIDTRIDGNYRLRRMYYGEAPQEYRRVRLGHAVAASACVPGLFEPLAFADLYPDRTVRLVDGGVHDNQGVVGLLEHDCKVLLVSDACGQMGTDDDPSAGLLAVPLRSNSILMHRVRGEQFDDLVARNRSGLLRGLMFIHLKQDLGVEPVDWSGCEDPHTPAADGEERTAYGILKSVQQLVADIRTDLDSFCDKEAFALMTSGYRMTAHAFESDESLQELVGAGAKREAWDFLAVEGAMTDRAQTPSLTPVLSVASRRTFKVWSLVPALRVASWVLAAAALTWAVWLVYWYWSVPFLPVRTIGTIAMGTIGAALFGKWVMGIAELRSTVQRIAIGAGLALGGCLAARLHLWCFDKLFLHIGRVRGKSGA